MVRIVYNIIFALIFLLLVTLAYQTLGSKNHINGKTYTYKSKNRTLELKFVNVTLCILTNNFKCKCIDPESRSLSQSCRYILKSDTLILQNLSYKKKNASSDLILSIPSQNCSECWFLSDESKKMNRLFGGNYLTDYQKYGSVPNIEVDTLFMMKNKIFLTKTDGKISFTFIFK